ncbi:MAG TPA: OpgC domain-containing protein, partial [Rhabdaerophilum sp.]|nr:OpgC domain-containing protein [Rhabdaerophilum sp.]
AAELFVFCSGLASSFAFGRVFVRNGWLAGARRILFRIWQVYWAHIGLALVLMTLSALALQLTGTQYPDHLMLGWFFAHVDVGLVKLMTLSFTPAFLDILPMYIVLLAMIPAMMALATISRWLPVVVSGVLWLAVHFTGVNLPGGQEPGMMWFFNPFAWQLVFFTGFSFGMGWLPVPTLKQGWLFWLAVVVILASVPVNFWAFTDNIPALAQLHDLLVPEMGKTNLVAPLYLHFLATAYVALVLVDDFKNKLAEIRPVILIGQQALATFMASIVFAWGFGVVLDVVGRNGLTTAIANLAGFSALFVVAMIARAYKARESQPAARSVGAAVASPAE